MRWEALAQQHTRAQMDLRKEVAATEEAAALAKIAEERLRTGEHVRARLRMADDAVEVAARQRMRDQNRVYRLEDRLSHAHSVGADIDADLEEARAALAAAELAEACNRVADGLPVVQAVDVPTVSGVCV